MNCPKCSQKSRVVDSRLKPEGNFIYRQRECLGCDTRFSTKEIFEEGKDGKNK